MALKRNHARLMREKGRNYLCLAQNRIHHTRNMSNIHLMPFAEQSYAMRLSTHGVTGTNGGRPTYIKTVLGAGCKFALGSDRQIAAAG